MKDEKCIQISPGSNIIVTETMDVYEVYARLDNAPEVILDCLGLPEDIIEEATYYVRKLPMKAKIDFDEYYGDDGKANWFHHRLPVMETEHENEYLWDY